MSAHSENEPRLNTAEQFIVELVTGGYTMLVLDMDLTLTGKHSRGAVIQDSKEHKEYVGSLTPASLQLLQAVTSSDTGLQVAIVTHQDPRYTEQTGELNVDGTPKMYLSADILIIQVLREAGLKPEQINQFWSICINPELDHSAYDNYVESKCLFEKLKDEGNEANQLKKMEICEEFHKKTQKDFEGLLKDLGLTKEENKEFFTYPPPRCKDLHLKILSHLSGVKLDEMFLLDDDLNNINATVTLGATGMHVKGMNGLTEDKLAMATTMLEVMM